MTNAYTLRVVLSQCVIALALLILMGGHAAFAQSGPTLDAGDRVKVTVFGEDDLSGEFELDGSGSLIFPLIGVVPAQGLTARALEAELDRRLRGDYLVDPSISVDVLTVRPFFVLGEVNSPGSYQFRPGLTVLNAVAIAGGFTFRANERSIELRRGGEAGQVMDATGETRIEPGDVIRIRERFF